jgi:hypothetical protein
MKTLDIRARPSFDGQDYRRLCQAIKASSRNIRAISLLLPYDEAIEAGPLAQALSSCPSLRFLELAGSVFAELLSTAPLEFFELLAPLPIEFLSFTDCSMGGFLVRLIDGLPLLQRSLLVLMVDIAPVATRMLKSKFDWLLVEAPVNHSKWPPAYQELSPKVRALYKSRPYLLSSFRLSINHRADFNRNSVLA